MQIYTDKLFKNPLKIIHANSFEDIILALKEIWKLREIYYLLGYVTYEFDELYFEVYDSYEIFNVNKSSKPLGIYKKSLIKKKIIIRM